MEVIIKTDCPCKRTKCSRHGRCDECRAYHASDKRNVPACDRLAAKKARAER